jgi:hypothetical protein
VLTRKHIDTLTARQREQRGRAKMSEQPWFKITDKSANAANAKAQIWEGAATLSKRSEMRNGYQYAKSQLNNLKTLRTIGNVAKFGGVFTSLLNSGMSLVKIYENKKVTASDVLNFVGTGVAGVALFVTGPVLVPTLAVTGVAIGAAQLIGSGVLDDIEYKFE